jgi:1,4-dihydroxy-2-naphthoyl-CoA hydrolase
MDSMPKLDRPPRRFMQATGLVLDDVQSSHVTGWINLGPEHHQPWGLVHGGLYTTVIETFATTGAFEAVRDRGQLAVGVSNVTDFIRPHRSGRLRVTAVPIQQGRTQQLWRVEMRTAEDDKLVALGQVRLQNIEAPSSAPTP